MKSSRKKQIIYASIIVIAAIAVAVLFALYYRQLTGNILMDHYWHLNFATVAWETVTGSLETTFQAVTYPLYHLSAQLVAKITGMSIYGAGAVVLGLCNAMAFVTIVAICFRVCGKVTTAKKIVIPIFAATSLVFVVACSPLTDYRLYARQGAANPVHNPTLLMARPFGLLAFLCFCLAIQNFEKQKNYIKEMVMFSALMMLSILGKPSFAFVLIPAMGIETLIVMIKNRRISFGIAALIAVLPPLVLILFQYIRMNSLYADLNNISYLSASLSAIAVDTSETIGNGIVKFGIHVGGFSDFTWPEIFKVSLATFPVPIILFSWKHLKKNSFYRVAMLTLLFGWHEMFFLSNGPTGDFSWGYDMAVQLATAVSLGISLKYKQKLRMGITYAVYAYQVLCGFYFMWSVIDVNYFWI